MNQDVPRPLEASNMIELDIIQQAVPYDINESRSVFVERMIEEGLQVSFPEPNELQIDIDDDAQMAIHERTWDILRRELKKDGKFPQRTISPSRSGLPCRHIRIRLPFEMDNWQRIAWQAALGSDPVRELLSCVRAYRGDEKPTLFLEAPHG